MSENEKQPEVNEQPIEEQTKPYLDDSEVVEDDTIIYNIVHETPEQIAKKEKQKKRRRRRYLVLRILNVLMILLIIAMIGVAVVGVNIVNRMISTAPDLELKDFVGEESSLIYDDKGNVITEIGVYLRENITYDQCPESLVDAFLSIEDSRFFTHFGFDIPRFTKAAIENLKNGNFSQGGSTFTMQLVKNTYFSIDAGDESVERIKSIEYKVQQIFLVIKLENFIHKEEIFYLHMNRINFGGNNRGVQKASIYYFGKDSSSLTLPESAMLAGIVNLPNGYNPYYHLEDATDRRNEVLRMMAYHGFITEEERQVAEQIRVEDLLAGEMRIVQEDSAYQSYLDAALVEAMELTGADPSIRGMDIYTYLNQDVQTTIDSIQNGQTEIQFPDDLIQIAIISMDNTNGAIIGMGGGRNYDGARLLNRATMNYKQPGSSIKPVISYALAFEYLGYSMDEILIDKPITYPNESMVLVNASGKYTGDITIKDAVAWSLNIPATLTLERVVDKIGKEKVVSYLQSIGFSRASNDNFHLSYAIGGAVFETTVKELAGAHAMIINHGVYNEPHTIKKVVMTDGTEYYPENQNRKVLSSGSAYLTASLMYNNVYGPYFNYMQLLQRDYPVYAKTGTTDWGRDGIQYGIPEGQMKDKWMVASSSHYTNAVWVGYDMAVAGEQTYFTTAKERLNISGNTNRLLLDAEEALLPEPPPGVEKPDDVEDVTFVRGSYPHVQPEDWMDGGAMITSQISKVGLENSPLVSSADYNKARAEISGRTTSGLSAFYDQYSNITISWGGDGYGCANGQRNISLHDEWNNVDMWGTCLVDLSWLSGKSEGSYWATIYVDGAPVGNASSGSAYFSGWVADLWGEVRVCGSYEGAEETTCTVAKYAPIPEENWENGWWDENGTFHPNE